MAFSTHKNKPLQNGETFPNLSLELRSGRQATILDAPAHPDGLVLVEFWASWCGKCLQQHDSLNALLSDYSSSNFLQGSGLSRIAISLDKDSSKWETALEQRTFVATRHFIAKKAWESEVVKATGVAYLPYIYILSPKGEILSQGLLESALRDKLQSWVKN